LSCRRDRAAEQHVRLRRAGCEDVGSFLHGLSVLLEHRGAVSAAVRDAAGRQRPRAAGAQRDGVRPDRLRLSLAHADAPHADAPARRRLDRGDCGHHRHVALAAAVAGDRIARVSRLLRRAVVRAALPATQSGLPRVRRRAGREGGGPGLQMTHVVRQRILAAAYVSLAVVTAILVVWTMRQGWAVHKLRRGVGDTWFYSADGRPWFRMDEQRRDVSLDEIAPDMRNAVIAVEDHRFYHHLGIDPIGTARAMWRDVRGAERWEGGSTLTQQLARTLFLSNKRTPARKAQEAAIALLLEQELSKRQILELYLNRIYLSAGVSGAGTMSQTLSGKPASRLTLGEAAMIAGLIRAPSALSPWTNYDGALDRRRVVLQRMREEGFITAAQER